jgi:hypothetical protein
MNGLPDLRLLPDAPVPDDRAVLTEPEALNGCNGSIRGRGGISPPFIPVTNSIEALHRQLHKIIKTRGHFPIEDAARKLIYLAITKAETDGSECSTGQARSPRSRSSSVTAYPTTQYNWSHVDTTGVTVTIE